jgi:hypothetical protein
MFGHPDSCSSHPLLKGKSFVCNFPIYNVFTVQVVYILKEDFGAISPREGDIPLQEDGTNTGPWGRAQMLDRSAWPQGGCTLA